MIDSSEERKHQLAFELQNSRVFEKRSSKGSLEKPRVGEIGILLKDFFGCSLIVKYTTIGLAHWLIIKKHISFFFFTIRTTLLYWVTSLFFCRKKNYNDQRRGRVSRFKIRVDWVRSKQSFFNTGEDFMLMVSKMNLFHLYSKSSLYITLQRVAPWKRIRITESGKILLGRVRNPAISCKRPPKVRRLGGCLRVSNGTSLFREEVPRHLLLSKDCLHVVCICEVRGCHL